MHRRLNIKVRGWIEQFDTEALKKQSERGGLLCRINGYTKPLTNWVFTIVFNPHLHIKPCFSCTIMAYELTSTSQLIFTSTSLWKCHVIHNTRIHVHVVYSCFPTASRHFYTFTFMVILTVWMLYSIITLRYSSPLLQPNYVTFQHNRSWQMLIPVNCKLYLLLNSFTSIHNRRHVYV